MLVLLQADQQVELLGSGIPPKLGGPQDDTTRGTLLDQFQMFPVTFIGQDYRGPSTVVMDTWLKDLKR